MTPSPVGAPCRVLKAGYRWYRKHYNRQYVTTTITLAALHNIL